MDKGELIIQLKHWFNIEHSEELSAEDIFSLLQKRKPKHVDLFYQCFGPIILMMVLETDNKEGEQ